MSFIDLVSNVQKNPELAKELASIIENSNPEHLKEWFDSKGYVTPIEECITILNKKDLFKNGKIIPIKAAY